MPDVTRTVLLLRATVRHRWLPVLAAARHRRIYNPKVPRPLLAYITHIMGRWDDGNSSALKLLNPSPGPPRAPGGNDRARLPDVHFAAGLKPTVVAGPGALLGQAPRRPQDARFRSGPCLSSSRVEPGARRPAVNRKASLSKNSATRPTAPASGRRAGSVLLRTLPPPA